MFYEWKCTQAYWSYLNVQPSTNLLTCCWNHFTCRSKCDGVNRSDEGENDPIIIHLMTKMLSQWNVYTVHPEKVYAENIVTSKSCNVKLNGWCGSFGATNGSHRYAIIYLIMVITFRITIKTEWIPIHKSITWFDIEIFGKYKSKSIWLF